MGEDRLLISEAASKALFNLLSNSGSLRGRTLDQVHERLLKVVNRLWEGGKVSTFTDDHGGGWLINISHGFGDVMLYAIARSVDGNRAVVNVIDEAELTAMKDGGSPPEPQADAPTPQAPEPKPVQTHGPAEPPPESPALLRWVDRGPEAQEFKDGPPSWEALDLPYKEVRDKVQELISEGIDPGDIEIWTRRKKPQVSVVLV